MEFPHAVVCKGVLDPFFLHMNGENIFTSHITLCMFTWLMACMWKSKEDFWENDQSSLLLFVYWSQNLTWQAWLHNYPLSQLFHPQIPFSQHCTAIVTIELQLLHLLALCLHSFFFFFPTPSVICSWKKSSYNLTIFGWTIDNWQILGDSKPYYSTEYLLMSPVGFKR